VFLCHLNHYVLVTSMTFLQVRVGNTTYYIGQLELAQSTDKLLTSLPFIVSVAAASGVLLTVILIICVAYRHKTRQSQRIVRRMQTQMDGLEARVANECKEGLFVSLFNVSNTVIVTRCQVTTSKMLERRFHTQLS